ncbi:hypothetical protein ACFV9E_19690 [Streptomyces sp. NPDC059835]|uniref:hypothetical protein n=1 Tax=Streptomyces sp. NPDC059835 TaxID=3346967 RepID=UPI00364E7F4C
MSFSEQWQEHKGEASMRLNGVPEYIVHADDLGRIGHDAYQLFNGMDGAGKHAEAGSEAAATALKGGDFETGRTLGMMDAVRRRHLPAR